MSSLTAARLRPLAHEIRPSTGRTLSIDFETFSRVDLKKCGLAVYAEDWSTVALLMGYAFDDEPAAVIDFTAGERIPERLLQAFRDPEVTVCAWNAAFERTILRRCFGIDISPERIRCSMVLAYSISLPGALDKCGEVIGLPLDKAKHKDGKRLIQKFCKPRKPSAKKTWTRNSAETDPEDWQKFKDYCAGDIDAEREIRDRLISFDMPAREWGLWALDQRINDNGLPISTEHAKNAVEIAAVEKGRLIRKAGNITGLKNPNSGAQMLGWLHDEGVEVDNLQAETVEQILKAKLAPRVVAEVLQLWASFKKTSVSKYEALARATTKDGRLHGAFQFAGAGRTWRWAGRIFQPQNLPRGSIKNVELLSRLIIENNPGLIEVLFGDVMEALSSAIRSSIRAPDGRKLVVADLNAIENRVLGWMAQCRPILHCFANNLDPYKLFAASLFEKRYEDVTKAERGFAKPPVLGCGYMLGTIGLTAYAESMGVILSEQEAERAKTVWRNEHPEVVEFWYAIDDAFRRCIIGRRTVDCWPVSFEWSPPLVRMWLPSGRAISYVRPRIEDRRMPWGEIRPAITYEGMEQTKRIWQRQTTHPGKITENGDQGIARDVLAWGLTLADQDPDLEIVGHVHDEIISLADVYDETALARLNKCLTTPVPWAPDLPLGSAGYESTVYKKD